MKKNDHVSHFDGFAHRLCSNSATSITPTLLCCYQAGQVVTWLHDASMICTRENESSYMDRKNQIVVPDLHEHAPHIVSHIQ